ncbi:MAG TPA: hypothetical protein VLF09_17390 [Cellvibrio sp.]|nr:hypothetical protein [Cellvibrio sp.]
MDTGKQYKVVTPDGLPFGYFLDNRLYEYRTSTCVGSLNEFGQLVGSDEVLGHMDGEQLLKSDGTLLNIKQ